MDNIKDLSVLFENQTGLSFKIIRSDLGGEYISNAPEDNFRNRGIIHEPTGYYQPQQNGIDQGINRTICENARYMLFYHDLSRQL